MTGKYNNGIPKDSRANLDGYEWLLRHFTRDTGQEQIAKIRRLTELAHNLGTTMTRMALAWCLKNPYVSTVITGASRPAQVEDNMQALVVVDLLTDDVMEQIENILDNKPEMPEF